MIQKYQCRQRNVVKKMLYILSLFLFLLSTTLHAQEIDVNDLEDFYTRLNKGQLSNNDRQTFESLQRFVHGSLIIEKTFHDKNGNNELEIKVINPRQFSDDLDDDSEREIMVDGWINYIEVRLNNENYSDTLIYYNPTVAESLIHVESNNISLECISGKYAIFIPFFIYNGNIDINTITFIVFYDSQKYLYHINFSGTETEYLKITDDLDEKFKELPGKLKKELIKQVYSNYKTVLRKYFE